MTIVISSIPPRPGRICSVCVTEITDSASPGAQYADREGNTYCLDCAAPLGAIPGFDCDACYDSCGCTEGSPGCPHFQCLAFAEGGIIRDDLGPLYASCPGAARRVVEVREQAAEIKLKFARLLPGRLFGDDPGDPEPPDRELPADAQYLMLGPAAELAPGAHVTGTYRYGDQDWSYIIVTPLGLAAGELAEDGPMHAKYIDEPAVARIVPCGIPLARKWQDGYGRWHHKDERAWCPAGWTVAEVTPWSAFATAGGAS